MENQREIAICERPSIANVQLLALLAAGLFQFVLMIGSEGAYRFFDNYAIIPPILFLGTVLTQKATKPAKRQLQLSLFMVVWFMIVQTQHEWFGLNTPPVGFFFCTYLLAFPFAALTQDGARQKGLKMVAAIFLAASLVMVAYTILLLLDRLPNFLKSYISINGAQLLSSTVCWIDARLNALWHPNTCANLFMIGIAFTIGFTFRVKSVLVKCLLWAASALQFMALALTNSRTATLMTCALIAAILFLRFCKGGWKRVIASMIAALAVIIGLFFISSTLYDLHCDSLAAKSTAETAAVEPAADTAAVTEEEASLESAEAAAEIAKPALVNSAKADEPQNPSTQGARPLLKDLRSLNGRTDIWKAVLRAIWNNPSVLIWGTDNPGSLLSQYYSLNMWHSHNSWSEVLLSLGLPGFLAALVFTWSAVRSAFAVLLKQNDMWKKSVALLVLCLLVVGMMEPFLFSAHRYTPFFDFIFFLCIGYMTQWRNPQSCEEII